jgi:hypothetical protein
MDNLSEAQTLDVPQPPIVVGVTAHSQQTIVQHNTAHSPQPTSSSHSIAHDRIVEVVAQEVGANNNRTEIVAEINSEHPPLPHQSSDVSLTVKIKSNYSEFFMVLFVH